MENEDVDLGNSEEPLGTTISDCVTDWGKHIFGHFWDVPTGKHSCLLIAT